MAVGEGATMIEQAIDPNPFNPFLTTPLDRRTHERLAIGCRILLTPIDHDGTLLIENSFGTVANDISQVGISLTHDCPLLRPRFLLSFREPELGEFVVEAEVVWTRMTATGRHMTGCRMMRRLLVPSLFGKLMVDMLSS